MIWPFWFSLSRELIVGKSFDGKILIRTLIRICFRIFYKFFFHSKVIAKSIIEADGFAVIKSQHSMCTECGVLRLNECASHCLPNRSSIARGINHWYVVDCNYSKYLYKQVAKLIAAGRSWWEYRSPGCGCRRSRIGYNGIHFPVLTQVGAACMRAIHVAVV